MIGSNRIHLWVRIIRNTLIGAWIVYYISLFTWSEEPLARFMVGLKNNIFFQILFVIFLMSLTGGFLVTLREHKKRSILYAIMMSFFPLGVIIFFIGFFLSAVIRNDTLILTGKDDMIGIPWSGREYYVMDVKPSIKKKFLDIEIEGDSPIFSHEPWILITDFNTSYRIGVYPPVRIDETFFHILNYGIAPSIRLKDLRGNTILDGDFAMKLLPPGNIDYAFLGELPYRITLKLLPSGEIKRGKTVAKTYNLDDNLYELKIFRIKSKNEPEILIKETITSQPISFDNYLIEIKGHTYWVLLEIVKDDAVYLIGAGIVIIFTGIIIRLILFIPLLRRPSE